MLKSITTGFLFAAILSITGVGQAEESSASGLTFQIYYGDPYAYAPTYYNYNLHRPFHYRYYKAPYAPYHFTYGW